MRAVGAEQRGTIKPDFERSISIDFQGVKITTDTGFLLMRYVHVASVFPTFCCYRIVFA